MSSNATNPPVPPGAQESYIVSEGKKRGSTRDVRPEAAHDRYYTVLRVHAGDAILTDNWHTNEVLGHVRSQKFCAKVRQRVAPGNIAWSAAEWRPQIAARA